jgi:stage II sporulation protein D
MGRATDRSIVLAHRLLAFARQRMGRWRFASLGLITLLLGSLLFFTPWGCVPTPLEDVKVSPVDVQRQVRVRLLEHQYQVPLNVTHPASYATSADLRQKPLPIPPGAALSITLAADGWRLGSTLLGQGALVLYPGSDGSVFVAGKTYHGQFRFVPVAPGAFDVVNEVDLDDYLKGVLALELLSGWSPEAYRAQAIVARTYALYERNTPRPPRHWDLNPDQRSQMYGGIGAETPKSREAVEATAGVVVAAGVPGDERIIKAYFSACCGGVTMAASDVMGDAPSEALSAQSVGTLCSASNRFNWGPIVVSKEELTRRFRIFGAKRGRAEKDMGPIQRISIFARNPFNRPIRYLVVDKDRHSYTLAAEELRWAVNTDAQEGTTLWSGFVDNVITELDQIRFVGGHGSGHGVGMCQWCAEARARAGLRHEDIVTLAFPGSKLIRAY